MTRLDGLDTWLTHDRKGELEDREARFIETYCEDHFEDERDALINDQDELYRCVVEAYQDVEHYELKKLIGDRYNGSWTPVNQKLHDEATRLVLEKAEKAWRGNR